MVTAAPMTNPTPVQLSDEKLAEIASRLDRCPTCDCNWIVSPPAKIERGDRTLFGTVRCVNCKAVYEDPGILRALVTELQHSRAEEAVALNVRDEIVTEAADALASKDAAIERLLAERDEARKALKPFAKYGELHAGQRPDFVEIGLWANNAKGEPDGIELLYRDFARARQVLEDRK